MRVTAMNQFPPSRPASKATRKKLLFAAAAAFCVVNLSGCGNTFPSLLREHRNILSEVHDHMTRVGDEQSADHFLKDAAKKLKDKHDNNKKNMEKVIKDADKEQRKTFKEYLDRPDIRQEHEAVMVNLAFQIQRLSRLRNSLRAQGVRDTSQLDQLTTGFVNAFIGGQGPANELVPPEQRGGGPGGPAQFGPGGMFQMPGGGGRP
jgi:hypothetical protein